jgi:hypothetical protein
MEHTLEITQGTTFNETVEIKDDLGVAENLTGSSFLLQIREYAFSVDYLISATDSNSLLEVTPLLGVVNIKLPPTETNKLIYNRASYDLIQTKPSGEKIRILGGEVKVQPLVSRA